MKICYFNSSNPTTLKYFLIIVIALSSLNNAVSQGNIEFVENKGQWDSRVLYKAAVSNGEIFIRNGGITVVQYNPVDLANVMHLLHERAPGILAERFLVGTHAFHVDFMGASPATKVVPDKKIAAYNNYISGNDASKWAGRCEIFQVVTLKDVYPDVDVRYYTENGFLKYDIIVKPGGDVSRIGLKYSGVDKLQVKNKELFISTSVGELKESAPFTFQAGITGKEEVNCRYFVKDSVVRFDVKKYDKSKPLIIDPLIVFCSFSGSSSDNWGFTATYGPDGSMYGGGIVHNTGFPTSTGSFQTNFRGGNFDIGIIKLSPNGSTRLYATYIGGSGEEQPHSLIVDNNGNLVLAGRTNSPTTGAGSYPVTDGSGGIIGPCGNFDIVVTKLNASGTALIGSKRIGGTSWDGVNISTTRSLNSLQQNYGDDGRSEVILDAAGNIIVASCTQSSNFPVRGTVFQNTLGGSQDGVVIKLAPDVSAVLFSSFLGGALNDAAYVLTVAPDGNIYVAGGTESDASSFPGNKTGTIGVNSNGSIDGFISIISSNGASILRTTFIGTSGRDQIFGIQFDSRGFPYITGQTTGSWQVVNNLPGSPAIYSNPGGKQFIAKLEPDLSRYVYSTMFGSGAATPNISITAFLVDRCENVYVSGWGGFYGNVNVFNSAGTSGLPVTSDAVKSTTDGKDFYFFVLKRNASEQLFGSFFGEQNAPGAGCDHVDGGTSRFDRNGVIYQAICANCNINNQRPVFPTTAGAWATFNNASDGGGCNLAMLKLDLQLSGVDGEIRSNIGGERKTTGCVPLTVDFIDSIGRAISYEWYFNYVPGNPPDLVTTTPNATFTYNTAGVYTAMLVAVDLNSCNLRDSSFVTIKAGTIRADLRPFWEPVGEGCPKFTYRFINNSVSTDITKPIHDTSMVWDFGDGSPRVPARVGPGNAVNHTYPATGSYQARLILKDTTYCNNPDDSIIVISIAGNVKAIIQTPASGCAPYTASLTSRSQNAVSLLWDFGDPGSSNNSSTLENPVHLYANPGIYTVRLRAINPGSCNISHDTTFTITVYPKPVPAFTTAPDPPQINTATTFTNLSSADAVRFKWVFGDGDSLLTRSRAPVTHQYNATGTFNACLTAYNVIGCDSTICQPVRAIIEPLADVPNAFTPLSNDDNSVVYVRGFGIGRMTFTIWNRWGQKVFETNNRFQGWDGRVKGVLQPMDVYVYTLNVEFTDGTKTTKKGDLTLIR